MYILKFLFSLKDHLKLICQGLRLNCYEEKLLHPMDN